jgi:hypothetical protein
MIKVEVTIIVEEDVAIWQYLRRDLNARGRMAVTELIGGSEPVQSVETIAEAVSEKIAILHK